MSFESIAVRHIGAYRRLNVGAGIVCMCRGMMPTCGYRSTAASDP